MQYAQQANVGTFFYTLLVKLTHNYLSINIYSTFKLSKLRPFVYFNSIELIELVDCSSANVGNQVYA